MRDQLFYTIFLKLNCSHPRRDLICELQVRGPHDLLVVIIKAQSIKKYETHQPWLQKRREAVVVVMRSGEMEDLKNIVLP